MYKKKVQQEAGLFSMRQLLFIEGWIHIIHIFRVEALFGQAQTFAEALEVNYLAFA